MKVAVPHGPIDAAPRWFDLLALSGAVLVGTVGSVGLLLAICGAYSTWVTLLLGLPVAAAMLFGAWRVLPATPAGSLRRPHGIGAVLAAVLAAGYFAFAGAVPSQNVIATRDPGLYMGTARWLTEEGDLGGDAKDPAFTGVEGLKFESAGVYDMGDGDVEFQFNHLSSVVMAVGHDLGGYRGLLRMPALATAAGLLALYAVTVRVTRRPCVSLVAPAVLACSMPLLNVARNTYSEPFAFVLLWGIALALAGLHRRPRVTMGLVGGFLLGALVATRVDALLYVALVFPLAAISIMCPAERRMRRRRVWAWLVVIPSAALAGTVGIVDLLMWTGRYASDLSSQLGMLRMAVVATAVLSVAALVLWRTVPALGGLYGRTRVGLAALAAGLIVAVLAVGWLVRPHVQEVRSRTAYEAVENIQRYEGVDVDPFRIYSEDSLRWMEWYLGAPTLVAAILGLATVAYLGVRNGRATPAAVGVCVLTLAAGALYWWKPSITPDHLWATRRFVPAIFPGLAVMAAVPLAAIAARSRPSERVRYGVVGVLALAMVIPPAATTWPVRWQRDQYGYLNPVLEACELVPDDGAVVVLGGYAGATLPHTLRSWCGVPVAAQGSVNAERIEEVADQVARNGHRLVLLSADSRDLASFLELTEAEPRHTNSAQSHWGVQRTLDRAPDSYVEYRRSLPVQLPFRLHVLDMGAG